ncbi:MAG TPA: hypothetical protein VK983_01930 [Candidatus Limnocylindrales bacterium]|nr:hypothetical protein [Candidatus Limnocylindrales bacterium]
MTETCKKLSEAHYFLELTHRLFNALSPDFEFHLNAFANAARNVTFVMQKEFNRVDGFTAWWAAHPAKADKEMSKFVNLRNISVKEKSVGHKLFNLKHDFGPEGFHVIGHKGLTSVESDIIRFDGPIPDHTYVTVKDDNGERRVKVKLVHDFSIVESYDHGTKQVQFDNFIEEAGAYLGKLDALVEECESKFK